MRKQILGLFTLSLLLTVASVGYSQKGKISGYMFGDYYYIAKNHDESLEYRNGFQFRRIYFTYDQTLSDVFSIRFRIELGSPGDLSSSGKIVPFLKDGYLRWKHDRHSIILGLSSTPTWGVVEKVWGYRSVVKTPLDLQKFGSSRDFGIAFKGSLDEQKRVNYHLMFANGAGDRSETNAGKKVLFALSVKLTQHIVVEGYVDFEGRPGHDDRYTLQGFAGYQHENLRFGVLYAHQNRQVVQGVEDLKLQIGSVFASIKLSEKSWAFARLDRTFDPNPDGAKISYIPFDATAKSTFFLAGLDLAPIKQVHIMPNVEAVVYGEIAGSGPASDIIPRLTFYYIWKSHTSTRVR